MRRAVVLLLLVLGACQQAPRQSTVTQADTANADGASVSELERAGVEAGVIADSKHLSPVGLYRTRHEAGTDIMCVMPPDPNNDRRMRFGVQAVFGESAACTGRGTMRTAGDKLILHFTRSKCLIVARYEGDRITLPGALDQKCSDICVNNGSLEGVFFTRTGSDRTSALAAKDRSGTPLCVVE